MKLVLGLFLVAHGLLHISYLTPKPDDPSYPFDFAKGWFTRVAGTMAKPIGTALAIATAICFVLAGFGVLGLESLTSIWQELTITGALASVVLLGLFWHRWLVAGMLIDVVLIYGLLVQHWDLLQK